MIGKLVVSVGGATYTITNFAATKPGVSPNLSRPPFDVMTTIRPLTLDEWQIEKAEMHSVRQHPRSGGAIAHVHVTG